MKRIVSIIVIAVLAVSMLAMTSCGKSELSGQVTDEKHMTVNAVNSSKGDYYVTGTLVVEENEQVVIDSKLEKGSIEVQFISAEGEGSIDELPETDGEPVYKTNLSGTDSQTVSFGGGSFMIKPVVTEKATGTIEISVQSAD